jgi:hypothetical protein
MTVSVNDVLNTLFLIAPQYQTTDPVALQNLQNMIALVLTQINTQVLVCNAALAAAFLTAAYLTLSTNPLLGVFSNEAEGQLSLGFNVSADMSFLNTNPYGRAYIDLINRTVVGSTVTNLPVSLGGVINNVPLGCSCGQGFGVFGGCC